MDPSRIVNNIIGGGKKKTSEYPKNKKSLTNKEFLYGDFDNDGVKNKNDCRPYNKYRHMVKYNYFEYETPEGEKGVEYAGSRQAVQRILEDKGIPYVPTSIRQLDYKTVLDKLGTSKMVQARRANKARYTNTGELREEEYYKRYGVSKPPQQKQKQWR